MPQQHADACNFVIFGATGDLAIRKLLPGLYFLEQANLLAEGTRIIGTSRSVLSTEQYSKQVEAGLDRFVQQNCMDQEVRQRFLSRIDYVSVDASAEENFQALVDTLGESFQQQVTIFYLSTAPHFFGAICHHLEAVGLVADNTRVVLEKPLGTDLETSQTINDAVGEVFDEGNTYRIDHYLGKEAVQNLLALRFANALFEPVWSNSNIDNVQITVAETVGVEGRWDYYDDSGALRDMVQNHMLQLLCLVAMGVPVSLDAQAVRNEKIKVLKSLKVMTEQEVKDQAVRGQYSAGIAEGKEVPGYTEEEGGRPKSSTETFVAIRADIHNWRWRGVPFYLRTGKRMASRFSEIVIEFKDVPHSIFPNSQNLMSNKLVIRLQPEESIQLYMMNKVPGLSEGMKVHPVTLNLSQPHDFPKGRVPEAYERLIYDVIRGSSTLFVHRREVEAAWEWCDAIQHGWKQQTSSPQKYMSGSWGPQAAYELVAKDGRSWHESK